MFLDMKVGSFYLKLFSFWGGEGEKSMAQSFAKRE